jgi:glycosyltransferase involved in cell wall biosynthesis
MNILYFSPIPYFPVLHGNVSTVNKYVSRLNALGHNVHFVLLGTHDIECEDYYKMLTATESFDIIPKKNQCRKKNKNGYYEFDSLYFDELGESIKYLCEKYKIDTIICTYIAYSKILELVPDNVTKIIDTHDKMTDRHLNLKKNNIKDEFFSCTEEDEAKYLQRADIIWARRDEETEFFNKITNSNKAITVTHFEPAKFLNKNYCELKSIGILASANQVNCKMVGNFIRAFNKAAQGKTFNFSINIAGQVKNLIYPRKKFLRGLSNKYYTIIGRKDKLKGEFIKDTKKDYINFLGSVDDIKDFYNSVDLILIPITFGTGINVKMVEAMAFGVPVLSTECGIKGMESSSKYHHCKNIEQMVDYIFEIQNNPEILNELAAESKMCYEAFYEKSTKNFDKSFIEENILCH